MPKKATPLGSSTLHFCGPCQRYFPDEATLTVHEWCSKSHNPSFLCPRCPDRFKSEDGLTAHMVSFCNAEPKPLLYKCDTCVMIFPTEAQLHAHLDTKRHTTKLHRCDHCSIVFKTHQEKRHHMMHTQMHERHNDVFDCQSCGATLVNDEEAITDHMRSHGRQRDRGSNRRNGNCRPPLVIGNRNPNQQSRNNRRQNHSGFNNGCNEEQSRTQRVILLPPPPGLVSENTTPDNIQQSAPDHGAERVNPLTTHPVLIELVNAPDNQHKSTENHDEDVNPRMDPKTAPSSQNAGMDSTAAPKTPQEPDTTTPIPHDSPTSKTRVYAPQRPTMGWFLKQLPRLKADGRILYEAPFAQEVEDQDAKYVKRARPAGFTVEIIRAQLLQEKKVEYATIPGFVRVRGILLEQDLYDSMSALGAI